MCRKNGFLRTSTRTEAVAVFTEAWIKDGLQHLKQGLLDQTIRYRRDTKLALATVRFRDRYPSYRQRPVHPRQQLVTDDRPCGSQMFRSLVNVQTINTGSPFIRPDPFPSSLQVLSCQSRPKQP